MTGGPARFTANSTGSLLLGKNAHDRYHVFTYGALTHYGDPSQKSSANTTHRPSHPRQKMNNTSHNPAPATPAGLTRTRFSLFRFRSPLLTESRLFSLPVGTEMFHFPTFPPHALYIQARVTRHHSCWVSPFGHPRITARLTAPRGLSQPPTSFIGSWCQGIHRSHLVACCYYKDARVHCEVLKIRAGSDRCY